MLLGRAQDRCHASCCRRDCLDRRYVYFDGQLHHLSQQSVDPAGVCHLTADLGRTIGGRDADRRHGVAVCCGDDLCERCTERRHRRSELLGPCLSAHSHARRSPARHLPIRLGTFRLQSLCRRRLVRIQRAGGLLCVRRQSIRPDAQSDHRLRAKPYLPCDLLDRPGRASVVAADEVRRAEYGRTERRSQRQLSAFPRGTSQDVVGALAEMTAVVAGRGHRVGAGWASCAVDTAHDAAGFLAGGIEQHQRRPVECGRDACLDQSSTSAH